MTLAMFSLTLAYGSPGPVQQKIVLASTSSPKDEIESKQEPPVPTAPLSSSSVLVSTYGALWPLMFATCLAYVGLLSYMLVPVTPHHMRVEVVRNILGFGDSEIGAPLPERQYATYCEVTWDCVAPALFALRDRPLF